jgi:uncharacterized protein (DUF2252 family)
MQKHENGKMEEYRGSGSLTKKRLQVLMEPQSWN